MKNSAEKNDFGKYFRMVRVLVLVMIISTGCTVPNEKKSPFKVRENSQGIELLENDHLPT